MNRAKNRITAMLNAITFAEAGEVQTAQELMGESPVSIDAPAQSLVPEQADQNQVGWFRRLEKHMAAVAFAESGDFHTAIDYVESSGRSRTVLLVIDGPNPHEDSLSFAKGLCARMDAQMDILMVKPQPHDTAGDEIHAQENDPAARRLDTFLQGLDAGMVPFRLIIGRGDMKDKLYDYARSHKDVMMIVCDSPVAGDVSGIGRAWQKMMESISRKLSVPLVVVAGKQRLAVAL